MTADPSSTATTFEPTSGLRVAYMTGQYPRATDTFIQREVAALRKCGVFVQTLSIRKPQVRENVGPEQQAERDRTFYVLPSKVAHLLRAHGKLLLHRPRHYLSALGTALTVRPAGLKALVWQAAYFVEAGVVADKVLTLRASHLHNHFSNSSCSVAMLAAELGGFTFSFTMHGPAEFYEPRYWRIDEKIHRARFVACISQFCRSQAMVFAAQECWNKLHVVHCGVNPSDFEAIANSDPAPLRLLFVGRLAAVKGLPILLQTLKLLVQTRPGLMLSIAGDGPDRERLGRRVIELGLTSNVEFLGYQSQQQVRELLSRATLFVMASFAEGVPVVLMEAMAAGVAVVATQIAGVPELVENGVNGYLVPPGDAGALADRIEHLLADTSLRRSFIERARRKVAQDFNINVEAGKLCRILTEAIAVPPRVVYPSSDRGDMHMTLNEFEPSPVSTKIAPSSQSRRYLLVTPCRDEAKYARRTLESIVRQTVQPALWIIVDDGSKDETPRILREYADRFPWIRIITRGDRGDRKLGGGVIDAFYNGYDSINPDDFDYVCKLDLDLDLPPIYFQKLIERMEADPRLGTCSGKPYFRNGNGQMVSEKCGDENSVGMVKFYRTRCFKEIGGFVRELMWDGIDCHRCRMLGWIAVSWDDAAIRFEHLRPMGTSHRSWWTGRVRHGVGQYYMGTGPAYMLASAMFRLAHPPVVVGAAAMLWGYTRCLIQRKPRYKAHGFRPFLTRYQWQCLLVGKRRATKALNDRQMLVWWQRAQVQDSAPTASPPVLNRAS